MKLIALTWLLILFLVISSCDFLDEYFSPNKRVPYSQIPYEDCHDLQCLQDALSNCDKVAGVLLVDGTFGTELVNITVEKMGNNCRLTYTVLESDHDNALNKSITCQKELGKIFEPISSLAEDDSWCRRDFVRKYSETYKIGTNLVIRDLRFTAKDLEFVLENIGGVNAKIARISIDGKEAKDCLLAPRRPFTIPSDETSEFQVECQSIEQGYSIVSTTMTIEYSLGGDFQNKTIQIHATPYS